MKLVALDAFLVIHDGLHFDESEPFSVTWYDYTSPDEVIVRIGDADGVLVNRCMLTAEVFEQCPNLKYVGTLGTGFNMIDLQAAKQHGVTVCNVPAYSTQAVAQATFSLLLNIATRIDLHNAYVKGNHWNNPADPGVTGTPMFELAGKTLGVIGMGAIGQEVAKIAQAMGMNVLAYRRNPDKSLETASLRFTSLDELLAQSDIVSLHCPLSEKTAGLIDAAALAKMKDGAVLLNTARGAILDEQAVSDALDSGKLYMAGVDVLCSEPPAPDNCLLNNPRCIITPHIAWMPLETRTRLMRIAAQNIRAFLSGCPIHTVA